MCYLRRFHVPSFPALMLALLAAATAIFTVLSSSTVVIWPAADAPGAFSVDEATYYEYVAPRLDRLVREIDRATALVEERSRNIVALSTHGARIEELARQIEAYGRTHPVPPRFATVHEHILEGTGIATATIAEARNAFQRLDFSAIPALIPRFRHGANLLHEAADTLASMTTGERPGSLSHPGREPISRGAPALARRPSGRTSG